MSATYSISSGSLFVAYLVVPLQGSKVFASLGKFTFLHTLTDIPMDEGTLGVHEVELVRERRPSLTNGSGVGQHAYGTVDGCEVAVGDVLGWLVADTNLEASRAPVNKLHSALRLEVSNGGVSVLGDDITTVQQAGSHVLSVARIALDHLVVGLEAGVGDLHDRVGLVGSLGGGDDGRISDEREVNTWVGDQVSLELVQIDVQGAIESEGGGDGRDDYICQLGNHTTGVIEHTLGDEAVQVLVVGALNAKVPSANVVDGLVVDHE